MSSPLPKIDIEAPALPDVSIDAELAKADVSALHGDGEARALATLDRDSPLIEALIQWLGLDKVSELSQQEIDVLAQMVSRMPEPVAPASFAWDVIQQPNDVRRIASAVDIYRRFNHAAVLLSEAMGSNDGIRDIIRSDDGDAGRTLLSHIEGKRAHMQSVTRLADRLDGLLGAFCAMFAKPDLSIAATVVAVSAAQTLDESIVHFEGGFSLPISIDDEGLSEVDKLRRHIVAAADKIRRMTGINPMQYSNAALSGVRRSLGEDASGDFVFAIEGLGGSINDDQDIIDSSQAFLSFFQQTSAFNHILNGFGIEQDQVPQLLAHVLIRRHFMTAARCAGIDWAEVSQELAISINANFQDVESLVATANYTGLTGQLNAVAAGRLQRPLDEVVKAARKHIVTQEYWLTAGDHLTSLDPEIRFADLKEVLRLEPGIDAAKEALKAVGANTSQDVDVLEKHVEWMTRAFALPITDEAVEAVIATKAEIIPMRLCSATR